MGKNYTTLKKFLLATILLALCIPLLQERFSFYEPSGLKGAIVPEEKLEFSSAAWWDGTYQEHYALWYNENFGFRPDLVRVRNQIVYSLFNEAKANGVIVGKEGYLFQRGYLEARMGKDYIGFDQVNVLATRLKAIQDSLEAKNITLVVCFSAGKASFYPEYIPNEFHYDTDSTNYKVMCSAFAANGINTIDFNNWLCEMKAKSAYPLFPKTGIHWSRYASLLVVDSLTKYVEQRRQIDLPNVFWKSIEVTDELRSPDGDIGEAMNLIWPISHFENMGYPVFEFEDTTGKANISLMAISDSFFWTMFDIGFAPKCFSNIDFYYYFREVHYSAGIPFSLIDRKTATENVTKHQVVLLMVSETNLAKFGWGFVNGAYARFGDPNFTVSMSERVRSNEEVIRADETWMESIKIKAMQKGISVDSMVHLDAVYLAEQQLR